MIEFHRDEARNIEIKATTLLTKFRRGTLTRKEDNNFPVDRFVSAHITDKDIIGEIVPSLSDQYGRTVAKFFNAGSQTWGLVESGYDDLRSLVALLSKNALVRKFLSDSLLENEVFFWCRARIRDAEKVGLTDYLKKRASETVKQQCAWVPVALLDVEQEFEVGHAAVRPLTPQIFDEMHRFTLEEGNINADDAKALYDKLRKQMQGGAAVVIDVCAERGRAFELAFEAAEVVVGLLRAFSPAAFDPELVCACAPLGTEHQPVAKMLFIQGGKFDGYKNAPPGRSLGRWRLDAEWATELKNNGLDDVAKLVGLNRRTQFQQAILDSHLLYSRSTMKSDLSDRIVYILTALESLFLKDGSEPIQQNLAERLAVSTTDNANERMDIIRNTKAVYKLR
ncbi:MAG: hypothetical protein IKE66_06765 [Hyphomicrobium sp.]|nr:hypothetical protein [Hyphomicrobium sp.]